MAGRLLPRPEGVASASAAEIQVGEWNKVTGSSDRELLIIILN
jgi:hypothetical protein